MCRAEVWYRRSVPELQTPTWTDFRVGSRVPVHRPALIMPNLEMSASKQSFFWLSLGKTVLLDAWDGDAERQRVVYMCVYAPRGSVRASMRMRML